MTSSTLETGRFSRFRERIRGGILSVAFVGLMAVGAAEGSQKVLNRASDESLRQPSAPAVTVEPEESDWEQNRIFYIAGIVWVGSLVLMTGFEALMFDPPTKQDDISPRDLIHY